MSKKNTINTDDMLSSSEEESVEKKVVVAKKGKNASVKETEVKSKGKDKPKKKVKVSDEEDEEEKKVLNKKKQRKGSNDKKSKVEEAPKKKAKIAPKKEDSEDEEEEEEVKPKKKAKKVESDNEEDEEEEVKPKKQANKKQVKKVESDDDSDDDNKEIMLVKKDKDPIDSKGEEEEAEPKKAEKKNYTSGTWKELFIKNLSYNTTQESLAEFFGKYGDIEETKIVYDKVTGRSKGVGFCRFYEADSANKAMEDAGNLTLDNRPIAISLSNEKPPITKAQAIEFKSDSNFAGERHGVFVGNLSFKSNEKGIESFFKDCGKIIDIRIAKTPEGKMRGFAHVDFDSSESVNNAVAKTGQLLDGRDLRIDRSEQKTKSAGGNAGRGRGGFNRGARVDPMIKAKTSGAMITTESKSKALDSDDE